MPAGVSALMGVILGGVLRGADPTARTPRGARAYRESYRDCSQTRQSPPDRPHRPPVVPPRSGRAPRDPVRWPSASFVARDPKPLDGPAQRACAEGGAVMRMPARRVRGEGGIGDGGDARPQCRLLGREDGSGRTTGCRLRGAGASSTPSGQPALDTGQIDLERGDGLGAGHPTIDRCQDTCAQIEGMWFHPT